MVLGLIDFLLGGKRKSKLPKNAQVATPLNAVGNTTDTGSEMPESGKVPNGTDVPTENSDPQFQEQKRDDNSSSNVASNPVVRENTQEQASSQRRPMGDVINRIHEQLKETNERIAGAVGDIKTMQNDVNSIGHRLDDLEESKKSTDEKLSEMDTNMTKFLSLYELINNQYNPFVEKDENGKSVEPMTIGADGNTLSDKPSDSGGLGTDEKPVDPTTLGDSKKEEGLNIKFDSNDLNSSLLELDTVNIEEAAGDAVPLTKLKNNTNSLVIILSWLEYMVKKVGIDETRNTLNYYTDTLKWITPEVYFDLDKYLKGMKEKNKVEQGTNLTIRDHIVSLYFISKLNERSLDPKLTRAVLQIIKE